MNKPTITSLIVLVIGLLLTGAAWIWPNVPTWIGIAIVVVCVLVVMLSQESVYGTTRSWFQELIKPLAANWRLTLTAFISMLMLVVFRLIGSTILDPASFVLTAILAASLTSLVSARTRNESIRLVRVQEMASASSASGAT